MVSVGTSASHALSAADPLDRIVVGAVARPMEHQHAWVGGQPPLDELGAVDDHIVANHRDLWRGRVGGQQVLQERGEAGADGADGFAGHLVAEAAAGNVDGTKDRPAPIGAGGHDLLALPLDDPGGTDPGEQVDVGLVFGQHDRAVEQVADLLLQVGEDLVAVGVALGDQLGPPPGRDLADAAVQGVQAHGGVAKPLVEPSDRPCLRLGQQPQDLLAEPWAAKPGPTGTGSILKHGNPMGVVAVDPAPHGGGVATQQFSDRAGGLAVL
jgi:hypothetical protein